MSVKQCPRCLLVKPLSDYSHVAGRPKGSCKACRAEKKRQAMGGVTPIVKVKPKTSQKAKAKAVKPVKPAKGPSTPRPPTAPTALTVNLPSVDWTNNQAAQFSDRASLEQSIRNQLSSTLGEYDQLIKAFRAQHDSAVAEGRAADANKALTSIRSTIKDKDQSLQRLTKQFELLANLDRPISETPEYTPVYLVMAPPPPSAFVVSPYRRPDEDYQEGQRRPDHEPEPLPEPSEQI